MDGIGIDFWLLPFGVCRHSVDRRLYQQSRFVTNGVVLLSLRVTIERIRLDFTLDPLVELKTCASRDTIRRQIDRFQYTRMTQYIIFIQSGFRNRFPRFSKHFKMAFSIFLYPSTSVSFFFFVVNSYHLITSPDSVSDKESRDAS